jgi:hypothetical protein
MNIMNHYNIKIIHEKFGEILNESFINKGQFKLFLKMVQGCIELKNDLSFFNGDDFLIHVPHKYLVESLITGNSVPYTLTDHIVNKSKIEAPQI